MKKLLVLFTVCLSFISLSIKAQSDKQGYDCFILEGTFTEQIGKQHNMQQMTSGMNIGYRFITRMYAYGTWNVVRGLYKDDVTKTYYDSNLLGGGIGFNVASFGKVFNRVVDIDLRASAATSIGDPDWKQTTYGLGVYMKFKGAFSPVFGLDFKHTNSHSGLMPDYWTVGATIGIAIF